MNKLADGQPFEDSIFHLRRNHKMANLLTEFSKQAEELILPLGVLRGGQGGYLGWMLKVGRTKEDAVERRDLEDALTKIHEEWIMPLDDYAFPVVTLSDETGSDAVCTIFETLNRTGVKLTTFELLTARFWPRGVNLRSLWSEALDVHPILREFDPDPFYLLQVISLVSGTVPSCKRSDILELDSADINAWWERAVTGMAGALEILKDDCGVLVNKWLPYAPMLVPLAALLASNEDFGYKVGPNRIKMARWFWCASLGQAYESGSNSQSELDFNELKRWLSGGESPEVVASFKFDPQTLLHTTRRQRAVYRAVMCLLLKDGPGDFYNFAKITGDLIVESNVDDHHIFPQGYLGDHRYLDSILNRTLIDRKTNIQISNHAPSTYMNNIKESYELDPNLGINRFVELLESHHLPAGLDSPFWSDDFETFLKWRQAEIWERIKEATGAVESDSDHVDDWLDYDDHLQLDEASYIALEG